MKQAKERFSDRVSYYVQSRPGYPQEILSYLQDHCGLNSSSVVADIGSGTGILAELFLQEGIRVIGVEPNREMRLAGEEYLRRYSGFESIDGSAEATGLPAASCDVLVAGQAFHWFDVKRAREEFSRILKKGAQVVLIWNDRRDETPFLTAYENLLLEFGNDYKQVDHRRIGDEILSDFFGTPDYNRAHFDHVQYADYEKLRARVLSCSYVPLEDDPKFPSMIRELEKIFQEHSRDGKVAFHYRALLYHSPIL